MLHNNISDINFVLLLEIVWVITHKWFRIAFFLRETNMKHNNRKSELTSCYDAINIKIELFLLQIKYRAIFLKK